jgi:hypothetical protein
MGAGWLNNSSIFHPELNKYIIKQDDDLGPSWEFPNARGVVSLVSSAGILFPTQNLTVDGAGESITPALVPDPIICLNISGAGGLDDDLKSIVCAATFIGKFFICKMAGAGNITFINGAAFMTGGGNFTENSAYDRIIFEVVAANTVACLSKISNA